MTQFAPREDVPVETGVENQQAPELTPEELAKQEQAKRVLEQVLQEVIAREQIAVPQIEEEEEQEAVIARVGPDEGEEINKQIRA